jgi:FixJ family two-component response regulator
MSSFRHRPPPEVTRPKPLVCIVDDDSSVRRALGRVLSSSGYQVEVFGSAAAYLDRSGAGTVPVCLLVDIHMPGQSGLALCRQLASLSNTVPIILVTAFTDLKARTCGVDTGAVDVLMKPLDADLLLQAVGKAVGQAAATGSSSSNVAP